MVPLARLKDTARYLLPPAVLDLIRLARRRPAPARPEWEHVPAGWAAADPAIRGWDVREVRDAYAARWPFFLQSIAAPRPFATSHEEPDPTGEEQDLAFHNAVMSFAYALGRAARGRERVSVLDWGGGVGHYYAIARALYPDLAIEYHCKDVPLLAERGRELFPEAHFSSDEGCLGRRYDLVLASGSLQYAPEWRELLGALGRAAAGLLLVNNTAMVRAAPSFVFVQRPYRYGYNTEYLGWCLNRGEFLACAAAAGLSVERELLTGYGPRIAGAPEQNQYRGFLLRPAL